MPLFLVEVCGTVAIEHKYYAPEWAKRFPKAEASQHSLGSVPSQIPLFAEYISILLLTCLAGLGEPQDL